MKKRGDKETQLEMKMILNLIRREISYNKSWAAANLKAQKAKSGFCSLLKQNKFVQRTNRRFGEVYLAISFP